MSLLPQEQLHKFIDSSKEIIIFIPENPSFDAIGSAWALSIFLSKKNIKTTIVSPDQDENKVAFLPRPENVISTISGAREFVLSFNTTRNKITGLRQETVGDFFNVYLTPEKGSIDPRDFSFILAKFKYDLIIVLDSPDLENLGKVYINNSDLFFEVPIVNIDHRSNNENFGQINLVDSKASSCAEILKTALENIDSNILDEGIATCLLTGIIGATNNFQRKNTTPKALLNAAELMDKGADQQGIIRFMYKTQPLNILKLLGRVMSKLNWEEKHKLAWTTLSIEDFVQSRSTSENLPIILEKLQENYTDGQIFMIIYNDKPESSVAIIKTTSLEISQKIALNFGALHKQDLLEIKCAQGDLNLATRLILEKLDNILL
ncbi:MAG: DHH family phosphoesterase [Candidatus Moraniibacteriota bacterium]